MCHSLQLTPRGLQDRWIGVADIDYTCAAEEIDIAIPVHILDGSSLPTMQCHRHTSGI
jgi:hypothetical protein